MAYILFGSLSIALAAGCGGSNQTATAPSTLGEHASDEQPSAVAPEREAEPAPPLDPTPSREVVFFAYDSAELTPAGKKHLDEELTWMQENPTRVVAVHGYADDHGGETYNLTLGNARANAVREYMVANGIDPARIAVVSHGEAGPELADSIERRALFVADWPEDN